MLVDSGTDHRVGLARDRERGHDLVEVDERAADIRRGDAIGAVDLDQCLDPLAERARVDPSPVADDYAVVFEAIDPALDRRGGEPDVDSDLGEGQFCVFAEQRNYLAICCVQRAAELHEMAS